MTLTTLGIESRSRGPANMDQAPSRALEAIVTPTMLKGAPARRAAQGDLFERCFSYKRVGRWGSCRLRHLAATGRDLGS